MKNRPSGAKLKPRSLEGHLVGYADSGNLFAINLPLKHKVDTVRQVKFKPSSYTSVHVHTLPPCYNLADTTTYIILEVLRVR